MQLKKLNYKIITLRMYLTNIYTYTYHTGNIVIYEVIINDDDLL